MSSQNEPRWHLLDNGASLTDSGVSSAPSQFSLLGDNYGQPPSFGGGAAFDGSPSLGTFNQSYSDFNHFPNASGGDNNFGNVGPTASFFERGSPYATQAEHSRDSPWHLHNKTFSDNAAGPKQSPFSVFGDGESPSFFSENRNNPVRMPSIGGTSTFPDRFPAMTVPTAFLDAHGFGPMMQSSPAVAQDSKKSEREGLGQVGKAWAKGCAVGAATAMAGTSTSLAGPALLTAGPTGGLSIPAMSVATIQSGIAGCLVGGNLAASDKLIDIGFQNSSFAESRMLNETMKRLNSSLHPAVHKVLPSNF